MLRFGKRKVILDKMKTFLTYLIFLLTMLGTSTASGNVSDGGKTCVIFASALESALISSRYFFSVAQACSKSTGHARKSLFFQTNFAFAFKLHQTTAPNVHSKV